MKYIPFNHCVVCGARLDGNRRYPHGAEGGAYCIRHAEEIYPTRTQRMINLRQEETREDIFRRFKRGERPEDIAVLYMVSSSAIRTVITQERYERERR